MTGHRHSLVRNSGVNRNTVEKSSTEASEAVNLVPMRSSGTRYRGQARRAHTLSHHEKTPDGRISFPPLDFLLTAESEGIVPNLCPAT
jgi:hypothetical protein